jgi:hypothetical protein
MEYFVVDDRGMKEGIPYYTLKETFGDAVQGTFYQPELNRVKVTEQTRSSDEFDYGIGNGRV